MANNEVTFYEAIQEHGLCLSILGFGDHGATILAAALSPEELEVFAERVVSTVREALEAPTLGHIHQCSLARSIVTWEMMPKDEQIELAAMGVPHVCRRVAAHVAALELEAPLLFSGALVSAHRIELAGDPDLGKIALHESLRFAEVLFEHALREKETMIVTEHFVGESPPIMRDFCVKCREPMVLLDAGKCVNTYSLRFKT